MGTRQRNLQYRSDTTIRWQSDTGDKMIGHTDNRQPGLVTLCQRDSALLGRLDDFPGFGTQRTG